MVTKAIHAFLWFLALCAMTGCAGTGGMVTSDQSLSTRSGEATIVFMRPSSFGFAISASVFDVSDKDSRFIGVIEHDTKIAYGVGAGEHVFMVVGESADFMKATVLADKTYYALVTPRMGAWKARFSFKPVRQADFVSKDFEAWDKQTKLVEVSPVAESWAAENAQSIESKRSKYWPAWISKPASEQDSQTLRPEDGR